MDILLIGGNSNIMENMINKLNKEGHRLYLLTGSRYKTMRHKNVFEQYCFEYDSDCIKEIFDSVNPQVTIFMGAYDTNYQWDDARREAVRYSAGLMNVLTAFSLLHRGRFIYLSSQHVFGKTIGADINEDEPVTAKSFKSMALAQGESMCVSYHDTMKVDTVVLRLDHIYGVPKDKTDVRSICAKMSEEALNSGTISANQKHVFSIIHMADAIEAIYKVMIAAQHQWTLYHISSMEIFDELQIAELVREAFGAGVKISDNTVGKEYRVVLSNSRFAEEFGITIYHQAKESIGQMVTYMKRHAKRFRDVEASGYGLLGKLGAKTRTIVAAAIPFVENMICFIPFFMLNNRAVGSEYFANLDFYLLYVLLFAIVYGQQQATVSAVLAVAGYCFRQMYNRTGFDVLLDYNTYVWMAQLFILGLVVGYMRDRLKAIKGENEVEVDYLSGQLDDIQNINISNVRMKNVLETQIVNQNDSFGKIYEITSSLDQYEAEEVLFYAAEVLSNLINSQDVAIYTVANRSFARLVSATSDKARMLGNSIDYTKLTDMYEAISEKKVYINKTLDEKYPLMANAIYAEDQMQLILMVWGIPWERMTLSQANMLKVIGYLIQNAVIRANRYLEALENKRYVEGTNILDIEAFESLVRAYQGAKAKGLTQCAFLEIDVEPEEIPKAGEDLGKILRQSDYLGQQSDGKLYALLSNTNSKDADFVMNRFTDAGYHSTLREEI